MMTLRSSNLAMHIYEAQNNIYACECFSLHDWLHMAYDRIDTHDNLKFFIILKHIASKRIKRDATQIYPRARLIYRRIDHKKSLPEWHYDFWVWMQLTLLLNYKMKRNL